MAGGPVTITATSEGKSGSASVTVTPVVVPNQTLTITIAGTGGGTVTSTPAGIACTAPNSGTCTASFPAGTAVALSPAPPSGSTFRGWSGGCTGSAGCTVTMDQARNVTGTFAAVSVVSVSIAPQTLNLRVGGTAGTLTATVVNSLGTVAVPAVSWTSNTPVVTVVATDAIAFESGPDAGTLYAHAHRPTTAALAESFTMSGSATNGSDYVTLSTTATIHAGQSSTTVQITPVADALTEGAETAILTLAHGSYTVRTPGAATVTMADLDLTAHINVTASTTGTFTVLVSGGDTGATAAVITGSQSRPEAREASSSHPERRPTHTQLIMSNVNGVPSAWIATEPSSRSSTRTRISSARSA